MLHLLHRFALRVSAKCACTTGKTQRKMQCMKPAQDLVMHSVDFSNEIAFTSDFSEWSRARCRSWRTFINVCSLYAKPGGNCNELTTTRPPLEWLFARVRRYSSRQLRDCVIVTNTGAYTRTRKLLISFHRVSGTF